MMTTYHVIGMVYFLLACKHDKDCGTAILYCLLGELHYYMYIIEYYNEYIINPIIAKAWDNICYAVMSLEIMISSIIVEIGTIIEYTI